MNSLDEPERPLPPARPATRHGFSAALLAWYRGAKRSLPWRERQDDAYAVWISEIMLQQTTVAAVIGFYERWMARFPTLASLAASDEDEVLRHWAGLGYYSRARNLKKAAELVAREHGGAMPGTVAELLRLPGVGRYTAGAIASIAFGADAPIVDANVARVLCRVDGLRSETGAGDTALQAELWRRAEELIPPGAAREFNQALMELGALVCASRAPSCPVCSVSAWCAARASGNPEQFPCEPRRKLWRTARHAAAAVFDDDQRFLLVRRPDEATQWAGFWELPRAVGEDGEPLEACAARAAREATGIEVEVGQGFGTVNHVVNVTKIALSGFNAVIAAGGAGEPARRGGAADARWIEFGDLDRFAIASPHRRLIGLLRESLSQPTLTL